MDLGSSSRTDKAASMAVALRGMAPLPPGWFKFSVETRVGFLAQADKNSQRYVFSRIDHCVVALQLARKHVFVFGRDAEHFSTVQHLATRCNAYQTSAAKSSKNNTSAYLLHTKTQPR